MKKALFLIPLVVIWQQIASAQWLSQNSGVKVTLTDVTMTDSSTAFVVGYDGNILKTTDAGSHWSIRQSSTQSNLNAVAFVSSLEGYAVGNGVICHTTDGGESWSASAVTGNYISVASAGIALDPAIFMGTDNGKIRYTYNNGSTWNETSVSSSRIVAIAHRHGPLNGTLTIIASQDSVYQIFAGLKWGASATKKGFWDEIVSGDLRWSMSYLVGGGGNPGLIPFVLRWRLTDSTWQRFGGNLPFPLILNDVCAFSDTSVVYICGSGGSVFRSLDTAASWIQQIAPTKQMLHAISFYNHDIGFIVGDSGVILHTKNGGLTSVGSFERDRIPVRASLSPNYPNPFNPTTKIDFSINHSSIVTLKIYNVVGQEVESLLSAWRDAGTYTFTWDATRFTSGVYYCRLVAGNFTAVQKLILTK